MAGSTFSHTETGAGALSQTVTFTNDGQVREIRLHLNVSSPDIEDLVVTLDSITGAVYDVVMFRQAMAGVKDMVQVYDFPMLIRKGDVLTSEWANSDGRTFGYELITQGL